MNAGLAVVFVSRPGPGLARAGARRPPLRDRLLRSARRRLGVLCLLMTRLSWPVCVPACRSSRHVQFPWRLMPLPPRPGRCWSRGGWMGWRPPGAGRRPHCRRHRHPARRRGAPGLPIARSRRRCLGWRAMTGPAEPPPPGHRRCRRRVAGYAPRAAGTAQLARQSSPATDAMLLGGPRRYAGSGAGPAHWRPIPPGLRIEGRARPPPKRSCCPQFAFPGWSPGRDAGRRRLGDGPGDRPAAARAAGGQDGTLGLFARPPVRAVGSVVSGGRVAVAGRAGPGAPRDWAAARPGRHMTARPCGLAAGRSGCRRRRPAAASRPPSWAGFYSAGGG